MEHFATSVTSKVLAAEDAGEMRAWEIVQRPLLPHS